MEKIKIGQIVNVVGLKGEVKVYAYSTPERYSELTEIYVDNERYKIENVRDKANVAMLKLAGIDDRNAAEAVKGKYIWITEDDLPELPQDIYYIRDLIGMDVVHESGGYIGKVKDVIQNSAQDLYEVERENLSPLFIPGVDEFVVDVNMNKREIKVKLPAGLWEL